MTLPFITTNPFVPPPLHPTVPGTFLSSCYRTQGTGQARDAVSMEPFQVSNQVSFQRDRLFADLTLHRTNPSSARPAPHRTDTFLLLLFLLPYSGNRGQARDAVRGNFQTMIRYDSIAVCFFADPSPPSLRPSAPPPLRVLPLRRALLRCSK